MKKQRQEEVTESQVLQIISDKISLDIFNEIAKNTQTSDNLKRTTGITDKQYYTKCSKLIRAGLIRRKGRLLFTTAFGKIVHRAQLKIARAVERNSMLSAIDHLIANTAIPAGERQEVIDKLIDDAELKTLVIQSIK